jgi:hypothetical protein
MSNALEFFLPEIRNLEQRVGFPVDPDEDGNCAIELQSGLILTLTFSPVDDRYGFHCLVLNAPAELSPLTCAEALRLNVDLARDEMGLLCYTDDEEGIIYSWTGRCSVHRALLEQILFAVAERAQTLHQKLIEVRNAEYEHVLFSRGEETAKFLASKI